MGVCHSKSNRGDDAIGDPTAGLGGCTQEAAGDRSTAESLFPSAYFITCTAEPTNSFVGSASSSYEPAHHCCSGCTDTSDSSGSSNVGPAASELAANAAEASAAASSLSCSKKQVAAAAAAVSTAPANDSLWPVFELRMQVHLDDSFAPSLSPSPLLQVEDAALKQQLKDRASNYVLAAMQNCLQDRHIFHISYSPKYTDSAFEYRVVCLPLDHPFLQLPQPILLNFAAAAAAPHFVAAAAAVLAAGDDKDFFEIALRAARASVQQPLLGVAAGGAVCTPERREDPRAAAAATTRETAAAGGAQGVPESERAAAAQAEAAAEEAPLAAAAVGMLFERSLQLPEAAWRSLGIRMSKGWTHVGSSIHESNTFLFARPLETDGSCGVAPPSCVQRAQQQQSLKRRLLEAFAGDALGGDACGPFFSLGAPSPPLPRSEVPAAPSRLQETNAHKQWLRRRRQRLLRSKQQPSWGVCTPGETESASEEEEANPFAALHAVFYQQRNGGRELWPETAKSFSRRYTPDCSRGFTVSFRKYQQQQQRQQQQLQEQERLNAHACMPLACRRTPRAFLLEEPCCCLRLVVAISSPLPPWAIPGVLVVYRHTSSSSSSSKCSRGASAGFACCCGRDSALNKPQQTLAQIEEEEEQDTAYVSTIGGLQQHPTCSDGFERFLLELEPLQQQPRRGEVKASWGVRTPGHTEALYSAVLTSPLLPHAFNLTSSDNVLPLSLQHLLLLLQQQHNGNKGESLILGHQAVVLGVGSTRGQQGAVAAIDAASSAALLKLEGKDDVITVRCTDSYLFSPLTSRS